MLSGFLGWVNGSIEEGSLGRRSHEDVVSRLIDKLRNTDSLENIQKCLSVIENLIKNNVEITSQNHGFEIIKESLPKNIEITHKSLFDNCIEGIKLKNKPVFSVQYHPESNPGPQDSVYLFKEFIRSMKKNAKKKRY